MKPNPSDKPKPAETVIPYGSVLYLQLLLQWRFGLKSVLLVESIHIQRL